MKYKYEYEVKFYFDEGNTEEYKIKNSIEQEPFTEEISNGFNEKSWYSFVETEDYKTIIIRTKDVYKIEVEQNIYMG